MRGIDSHQHFWIYDPTEYPWIKPDWPIRRNFLPRDLEPLLARSGLEGCVAVQARQTIAETHWLLELAQKHSFIGGVVGWVDLRSERLGDDLAQLAANPKFAGVRHVLQDEPDDEFMLRPEFIRGIGQLEEHHLTYDLLVFPRQLPAALKLAQRFPAQSFILDHIAKPSIRDNVMEPWRTHLRELARCPNVSCKLSGMVTEARWNSWEAADFRPFLDVVWEAFGEDRLMIGSDWPVCLLSGEYENVMGLAFEFLSQFSSTARQKVVGDNAARLYRLKF